MKTSTPRHAAAGTIPAVRVRQASPNATPAASASNRVRWPCAIRASNQSPHVSKAANTVSDISDVARKTVHGEAAVNSTIAVASQGRVPP